MKWCPRQPLLICTRDACASGCAADWTCPRCSVVHAAEVEQCPCTTPEVLGDGEGRVELA